MSWQEDVYRESARKSGFYAAEFADALRELLRVPLGDPLHAAALIRCKAILETYDEDQQTPTPRLVA